MEKHIYFVRHGQSDSNTDGIFRGADSSLTDEGREQAKIVAQRVKKIGVEALISSPYIRTVHTAEEISRETALEIEESQLFTERRRPSEVKGRRMSDPDIQQMENEIFEGYDQEVHRYSDEENFIDLRNRANAALKFLANHEKDRICVVSHGIFLRVLLCAVIHGPKFSGTEMKNMMRNAQTENTGISHFILFSHENKFSSIPLTRWILENWNDSNHLN
jgi:broad specificity phosphatase PhoE